MTKLCARCSLAFSPRQRERVKGKALFCSRACWLANNIDRIQANIRHCQVCHSLFYAVPVRVRSGLAKFCSSGCAGTALSNSSNARYRVKTSKYGDRRFEHVHIAESALGHALPAEAEVHHVNGNGRDNANSNLVICQDHAYHFLLHVRARVLRAGGNPNTQRICTDCKVPVDISLMSVSKGVIQRVCRECANARQTKRRRALVIPADSRKLRKYLSHKEVVSA